MSRWTGLCLCPESCIPSGCLKTWTFKMIARGMGWGGRREGGSGWGTHVNPWLIHVNVWRNPLQYCKVISLQLIKINEKKRKKEMIAQFQGDLTSLSGLSSPPFLLLWCLLFWGNTVKLKALKFSQTCVIQNTSSERYYKAEIDFQT